MEAIKVVKRDSQTKANQLRRHDIVPCCVYGGTLKESISIQMEKKHAKNCFEPKERAVKFSLTWMVISSLLRSRKRKCA